MNMAARQLPAWTLKGKLEAPLSQSDYHKSNKGLNKIAQVLNNEAFRNTDRWLVCAEDWHKLITATGCACRNARYVLDYEADGRPADRSEKDHGIYGKSFLNLEDLDVLERTIVGVDKILCETDCHGPAASPSA
jgi:hypothetical protein